MEYVDREIKDIFYKTAKIYRIIAIVGARQSGKTTFLKKISENFDSKYVFFDDPDAIEMFEKDIKKFENQYLNKKITILDEVQGCKDAGRKLKYLADSGYKLWITSSSEIILSKKILSYLVGRVSIIKMFPFSLEEFLDSKKQKEITSKILQRNIYEHCNYGGYPRVVTTKDIETKKIILGDLYQTMILKDIANTFSIENIESLRRFVKYLSHNIGEQVSYENVSSDLNISFQTVKKYLDAMEKSYLIYRVSPFYRNKIKEITKQPKMYFIDTGLRNEISGEYPKKITGELFENYVLSELLKMGFSPKYWRTKMGSEVDFVIEKGNKKIPIEVKINPNKLQKGFRFFLKDYKIKKAIIVNYEGLNKKEKDESGCEMIYTDILNLKKHLK